MKFPDEFIAQVKTHFRLSDYIGKTVELKRQGREYVGLSPFNREKTPSFYVNDEKNFFCDFSSGKTGDIVDWVMATENLNFPEAVRRISEDAGIPVPEQDRQTSERDQRRRHLENILGAAQNFFLDQLLSRSGADARAYLERRGLGAADWHRFGIGYAPDGGLMPFLASKRFSPEDAVAAGVAIQVDGRRPYDRYRNRITFPISDIGGRPISFGGRALDPKAKAKYLNGPDTELFDKGRNLYGMDMARRMLAGAGGPLLAVEGYMDVIACQRAGIAACAPMGTSLTEAQMEIMWRYHPEPTLCFDGDQAGRRAAHRAMDMAISRIGSKRSVRFSMAVGGKDADEVLRTQGADALRAQLSRATPLAVAIFQREHAASPLATPEQRADLRDRLRKIVEKIGDRPLRQEYGHHFKASLDALNAKPGKAPASPEAVNSARALRDAPSPIVRALCYWLVKDPDRAADEVETLDLGFGHPQLDEIAAETVHWMMAGGSGQESLAQHLHQRGLSEAVAALGDPDGRVATPAAWKTIWRAWTNYRRACAELEEAKARVNTPEDMKRFLSLKARRDEARRAL